MKQDKTVKLQNTLIFRDKHKINETIISFFMKSETWNTGTRHQLSYHLPFAISVPTFHYSGTNARYPEEPKNTWESKAVI